MTKFNDVLNETLKNLVENGIDPELIEAALNKITFQTKEAAISEDNPRGVLYAITSLSTWLYGEDPYINLEFSKYLKQLAKLADTGYFEKLIEDKLLNNPLRIEISLKAEPGKMMKMKQPFFENCKNLNQT